MSTIPIPDGTGAGTAVPKPAAAAVLTDCLIVGTGPAGGALASFLGFYGIKGIIINRLSTTTISPRAHITNMATMECMRDIGLEAECRKAGLDQSAMTFTHWCENMAGAEYARAPSWGNGPAVKGRYEAASPCAPMDLAQTLFEPILNRRAVTSGFQCRFDTEFVSFHEETSDGRVHVRVRDNIFGAEYVIACKYLFGADGARSRILSQLDLPLKEGDGGGVQVWNVLVEADLSHLMRFRGGNLHWTFQEDHLNPGLVWTVHPRMVNPWNQWVVGFFVGPGSQPESDIPATQADWEARIKRFIGDDSVSINILDISPWKLNNLVAEQYSKGRVFCLGDAVHRHTPGGGLGSNTSVQDAYNLAWKVAYVLKGIAGPGLLETYSHERQPVGAHVTERAMKVVSYHVAIWDAIGQNSPTLSGIRERSAKLRENSKEGREYRAKFRQAISNTCFELQGIGIEMNQRYRSSSTYLEDQGDPPVFDDDLLEYNKTTYPGSRLPHAWINTAIPREPISTIDLAGKGRFTLITGIGGEEWKTAAASVGKALSIEISAVSIGFGQDFEDVHFEWERLREVEESGCVLVRPDRFVAWRSNEIPTDCVSRLREVLQDILSLG